MESSGSKNEIRRIDLPAQTGYVLTRLDEVGAFTRALRDRVAGWGEIFYVFGHPNTPLDELLQFDVGGKIYNDNERIPVEGGTAQLVETSESQVASRVLEMAESIGSDAVAVVEDVLVGANDPFLSRFPVEHVEFQGNILFKTAADGRDSVAFERLIRMCFGYGVSLAVARNGSPEQLIENAVSVAIPVYDGENLLFWDK